MLDYRKMMHLYERSVSKNNLATIFGCKWMTVDRAITRINEMWGDCDSIPSDLTNDQIRNLIIRPTRERDEDYLWPDFSHLSRKDLKKMDHVLWDKYVAEALSFLSLIRNKKDKGNVEAHVKIVENSIIPELDSMPILSLEEYNRLLLAKVEEKNGGPRSKKDGTRLEAFMDEEKPRLKPLPTASWKKTVERELIVSRDFHIQYSNAFYSVPVDYIGQKVTARGDGTYVRIYTGKGICIAEHRKAGRRWQRCTDPKHAPLGHDVGGREYSLDYFLSWACRKDKRVKWTNFPTLYRELDSPRKRDSKKFETKLTCYSKFDLLCIDEFLNCELKECFLIRELLNRIALIKRCSLLVCSQVNPLDWVKLFPVTGIGESARGRIMHISKSIHLKGKDLRMEGRL